MAVYASQRRSLYLRMAAGIDAARLAATMTGRCATSEDQ